MVTFLGPLPDHADLGAFERYKIRRYGRNLSGANNARGMATTRQDAHTQPGVECAAKDTTQTYALGGTKMENPSRSSAQTATASGFANALRDSRQIRGPLPLPAQRPSRQNPPNSIRKIAQQQPPPTAPIVPRQRRSPTTTPRQEIRNSIRCQGQCTSKRRLTPKTPRQDSTKNQETSK